MHNLPQAVNNQEPKENTYCSKHPWCYLEFIMNSEFYLDEHIFENTLKNKTMQNGR